MSCDVGEETKRLENDIGNAKEGLEKSCGVGEATEGFEGEL